MGRLALALLLVPLLLVSGNQSGRPDRSGLGVNATPRRITFSPEHESMPAWEPGSRRIAYRIGGSQASGGSLGFVQSDGSVERTAAVGPSNPLGFITSPSWIGESGSLMLAEKVNISEYLAFDASQAPFVRSLPNGNDEAFTVKLVALPGSGSTIGAGDHVRVSRDGSTVAWRITGGGTCNDTRIRVAPFDSLNGQIADDVGEVVVSDYCSPSTHELFVEGFALTPDGSQLIVSRPVRPSTPEDIFPPTDLFIYSTSGGGGAGTPLTTSGAGDGYHNEFPDVSPDGTKVAFTQRNPDGAEIYTIGLDGSDLTRVTDSGGKGAREPSWSPDGRSIVFSSLDTDEDPPNLNLYVVDLEQQPGPFLSPAPDVDALRDALVDSDFDDLPEPGSDARLIVEREGNRITLYQADAPQRVWEILCSDPHPVTGRFQTCRVTPPELPEPNGAWQRLVRFLRRTIMGVDAQYHTISVGGYDSALRIRSLEIASEISSNDVRETTLSAVDDDGDQVPESFALDGFLFLPSFDLTPAMVDVTGDGNPDYAGWPITYQGGRYFTPLSDSNGDGVPDSVNYDFDRDGRPDSEGIPIFADVISGPPPGEAQLEINFAQFGKGEAGEVNLGSQIALFNLDPDTGADVSLEIRGDDGGLLPLQLNGEEVGGLVNLQVPAGGLRILQTNRLGEILAGSVRAVSGRAVAGTILFGGSGGLAGVGISHLYDGGFAAIVESRAVEGKRTGIAIRNLEETSVQVELSLYDPDSAKLGKAELRLAARGHRAVFVDELEWATTGGMPLDFSDFSGVLEAEAVARLAATVIETLPQEIATLPVAPLTFRRSTLPASAVQQGGTPPAELAQKIYFAQFGDGNAGASIRSQIFLLNLARSQAHVRLLLRDDQGAPLTVDLNGQPSNGERDLTIPPGGLAVLGTDGEGDFSVGSATVCSDQYLAGTILFSGEVGVAGVGASPLIRKGFRAPMERRVEEETNTGLAIVNLAAQSLTLDLQLVDPDGSILASAELAIPAFGHRALFLDQITWVSQSVSFDLGNFRGLLQAQAAGQYSATVIRTSPGVFATQPVVPSLN